MTSRVSLGSCMTSAAISKRVLAISNRFSVSFTIVNLFKFIKAIGRAKVFGFAGKGFVQRSGHVHIGPAHRVFLHFALLNRPSSRGILRLSLVKLGLGKRSGQECSEDGANKVKKQ